MCRVICIVWVQFQSMHFKYNGGHSNADDLLLPKLQTGTSHTRNAHQHQCRVPDLWAVVLRSKRAAQRTSGTKTTIATNFISSGRDDEQCLIETTPSRHRIDKISIRHLCYGWSIDRRWHWILDVAGFGNGESSTSESHLANRRFASSKPTCAA